jgi:hypothetical protein
MATFRHATPGSITATKRVIVSDAITDSGSTEIEIQQPANSIITGCYVRFLDDITVASGNVGFKMGTVTGGDEVVGLDADGFLAAGTDIPAGTIYTLTTKEAVGFQSHASATPSASVTTDDRTLFFTLSATTAASTNGRVEITAEYRILD